MTRQVRPFLIATAAMSAAGTAYLLYAAGIVQKQLDAAATPGCTDPSECYPAGAALDAIFGMELVAAFVPPLLGLILAAAVAFRARGAGGGVDGTGAEGRGRAARDLYAILGTGLAGAAIVALVHRLDGMRYTALAGDTFEMLQLLHLGNPGFMIAQAVLPIALASFLRRLHGPGRALALTVVTFPFAFLLAAGVALLIAYAVGPLVTADSLDPFAYLVSAVVAAGVASLVWAAQRENANQSL